MEVASIPLNSVQQLCQQVLDGLPFPGSSTALKAQITPPMIQNLNGPVAFVWGGTLGVDRQTGPRGDPGKAGFKRLRWDVDVWLIMMTNPNNALIDQQFPLLLDAVMAAFWSTEMPRDITDPTTQLETQILSIGEDFRMVYSPVHAPQTQRMLYYEAHLSLSVYEAVQA